VGGGVILWGKRAGNEGNYVSWKRKKKGFGKTICKTGEVGEGVIKKSIKHQEDNIKRLGRVVAGHTFSKDRGGGEKEALISYDRWGGGEKESFHS